MNDFFEMFELAKNSGAMSDELQLYNAINNSSNAFGKARFDAGYDLGFTHGKTRIFGPLYPDKSASVDLLKKAISEVLELSEILEVDSEGNPPFTSEMGLLLNRALEGIDL